MPISLRAEKVESWTDMTGRERTGNCLQIIGTEVKNEPKITAKWCTKCQLNLETNAGKEKVVTWKQDIKCCFIYVSFFIPFLIWF